MYLSPQSSIVILTGAGISAGNTFRGDRLDALDDCKIINDSAEARPTSPLTPARKASKACLSGHAVNDCSAASQLDRLDTLDDFASNPDLVHAFYNQQRSHLKKVDPNPAHRALARLDKLWPGEFLLITENVDDLHERSGSHRMVHMYGELKKVRCLACGAIPIWRRDVSVETPCPECGQVGKLRPHVVWSGEKALELERIFEALSNCNLFIAIGASGLVSPACEFVGCVSEYSYTLEIHLQDTPANPRFFEHRTGPASILVPTLVDELLEGIGIQA